MKSSHDPLRGRFVRYLMIAAKYGRLNYLSKRKAAPKTCSLDSFPSQGEPSAWEEDPLCIVIQRETMARAFGALSALERETLELLLVQGLTPKETAERMKCSVAQVYQRKSRALKHLREKMGGAK